MIRGEAKLRLWKIGTRIGITLAIFVGTGIATRSLWCSITCRNLSLSLIYSVIVSVTSEKADLHWKSTEMDASSFMKLPCKAVMHSSPSFLPFFDSFPIPNSLLCYPAVLFCSSFPFMLSCIPPCLMLYMHIAHRAFLHLLPSTFIAISHAFSAFPTHFLVFFASPPKSAKSDYDKYEWRSVSLCLPRFYSTT